MQTPLLSVIIPTKNRQRYAVSAVRSLMQLDSQHLEVVVQDNSDSDTLRSLLSEYIQDRRLIFRYTKKSISSIDNFNAAVELATGLYVCMIGQL